MVTVLFKIFQDKTLKNLIYKAKAMDGRHAKDVRAGRHIYIAMEFIKCYVFFG